jgi:two-component system, OmpR family, sensor histidine kinase VicK
VLKNATTFIIKGRKRALKEAYDRSLNVKYSYYCITGDELVKSYRPFIPLLYNQVFERGGKSYIMTNIEKETLVAVKDLTKAGAEVKHIDISVLRRSVIYDDSVAYFSITEPLITKSAWEYVDQTEGEDLWVGSTEASVVESAKKHFLSDWKNAIPSVQKIQEIEEGKMQVTTRILQNEDEITKELIRLNTTASRLSICSVFGGMQMSHKYLFDSYQKILNNEVRSEVSESDQRIRWITNIDSGDSLDLVRVFLGAGIKVRHVKNLPPMSFGVSDKEIAATIEKMEGGRVSQSFLVSNEPFYVDHFSSIFEQLWRNGIDAIKRIKDIEAGADLTDIEVIQNPKEGIDRAWSHIEKSEYEVLSIFATANAFRRQMDMGLLRLLKEATEQRHVEVRILIPGDKQIKDTIDQAGKVCPLVDFRVAEENFQTRITIVLIDKKDCMIVELRDDRQDSSYDAAGVATYSNSKSIISSYACIFESLWKQNELYEQLKINDKMQKEFINVAAHELRTPIQPILGLADILRSKETDGEEAEYLDVIIRNARRLQRLTEDILDISRIESKSLELKKESFNLNEMILNAIADSNRVAKEHEDTTLKLEFIDPKKGIFVEADKNRINQVISNLLSNAIKFTDEGIVSITTVPNINEIVVNITDTGSGIDSEILPRLFTKFATKSKTGTGLGLFISKSIIDAHGGKIWGKNNYPDGKGATFGFSLPFQNPNLSIV